MPHMSFGFSLKRRMPINGNVIKVHQCLAWKRVSLSAFGLPFFPQKDQRKVVFLEIFSKYG